MYDVIRDLVQSEGNRVTGYYVVPIAPRSYRFIHEDYGNTYINAKVWLIVSQVVDHGGEGIEDDMEETVTCWICDKNWLSFDDTPFLEHPGSTERFIQDIQDAYDGELY